MNSQGPEDKEEYRMERPENGLYMAHVTDDEVRTFHADEEAVYDAQTSRLFEKREQQRADQKQAEAEKLRRAEACTRAAAMEEARRKRRFWNMVKAVSGWLGAAALVYLTYRWGLLAAVGSMAGCAAAACCRICDFYRSERG